MEATFKKLLYAGVGLASQVTEKFEKQVDELVEKGKLSDSEAKKLVDDMVSKTEERREEFDDNFKSFVEKFGYTKAEDLAELRKKVEDLETKLQEKKTGSKSTSKATAK